MWTPYKVFYDNPISWVDKSGKTEPERQEALRQARKYVDANPLKDSKLYGYRGWHRGAPGYPIDCSGMVSQVLYTVTGKQYNTGNHNGVANIVSKLRKVQIKEIRPGDLVTMSSRRRYKGMDVGHIAFIEEVIKDEDGNVTGIVILHSSGSKGPNRQLVDFTNDKDYYNKKFKDGMNFWQWDTPEPSLLNKVVGFFKKILSGNKNAPKTLREKAEERFKEQKSLEDEINFIENNPIELKPVIIRPKSKPIQKGGVKPVIIEQTPKL